VVLAKSTKMAMGKREQPTETRDGGRADWLDSMIKAFLDQPMSKTLLEGQT